MGVRSLGVALTAAVFTGMVFALQSAVNMARFGAENYVGPLVALAIFRELGPVLTAILVGGKVASGITAELGSMKVTEQIDALRTLGVNYIKRLVVPRVLAALIVFPLLTVLADVLGVLGGMVIMYFERGTDMYAYWNATAYWVRPARLPDRAWPRASSSAAIVTLIGCYNGLSTEGGTEGLGRATTATVVHVRHGRHRLRLLPHQALPDALLVMGRPARAATRSRPTHRSSSWSTSASGSRPTTCSRACR